MQEVRKKPSTPQEFLNFLTQSRVSSIQGIQDLKKISEPPDQLGSGGAFFLMGDDDEPMALAFPSKAPSQPQRQKSPGPDQELFYLDLSQELVDWQGFFHQLGDWWATGNDNIPFLWISAQKQPSKGSNTQGVFFLDRPQLWRSWASSLPQNLGKTPVRWIPEKLSTLPTKGWITAKLETKELLFQLRSAQSLGLRDSQKTFPESSWGLHWKLEYRGIHIPVFQPLGTSLPAILQRHWKTVLSKINSTQFSMGGKNLLRQLPWVSTLLFFLGQRDASLVLDFLRRSGDFSSLGGLSKLFFYTLRTDEKSKVFATPFCSPKRINRLLPPLAQIQPTQRLGDQDQCRKTNISTLEALARSVRTRALSLTRQGNALIKGLMDSYSELLGRRIELLARKGLPVGQFSGLDNFMKQLALHKLSDRKIILCFLDQGNDFWRQLRFWVTEGRYRRLMDERESVKRALLREEYLLDDRWEAIRDLISTLRKL